MRSSLIFWGSGSGSGPSPELQETLGLGAVSGLGAWGVAGFVWPSLELIGEGLGSRPFQSRGGRRPSEGILVILLVISQAQWPTGLNSKILKI